MYTNLINKINELRNIKKQINFIQIGAYDGHSMDDIANIVLNENDKGIFIEPNPFIINDLKENKKNFKNATILEVAVIPDENFFNEFFHVHINGGGSSFIRGLANKEKTESENFKVIDIKKITVNELFKKYVDFDVDIVFTDCEGYDFDINKKILQFCKPSILYMEAWDTKDLNNLFNKQRITTRNEMFKFLEENSYQIFFESKGENLFCYLN
jgi:FkbM family methyltransferase